MSLVFIEIGFGFAAFAVVSGFFWFGLQKYPRSELGWAIAVLPSVTFVIGMMGVSHHFLAEWEGHLNCALLVGMVLALGLIAYLMRLAARNDAV